MTHSSFYFTKAGIIIPTVTGTISFLSSSTIIYIILRSKSGVKITYHRIILGLSIADCLTSFVSLLTTIPMPKDVIYPFALASYGNVATCEAQGLIYIVGNVACFSMNGILNIYYLCSLRFNMKEHTFRNYLEIPLYILMLALSIGVSCGAFLNQEIINPSPTDPFCVPNSYPVDCTKEDNPDCRGGGGRGAFTPGYLATLSIGTSTLLVTMTLIIHSFYRNERKLRKSVKDKQIKEDDEELQALLFAQKTYGIITRQALLYIAAFVITWIFGFFEYLLIDRGLRILSILRILLQPLQGLFNLMIFVYHKAFMLLRSDEDMTIGEAIIEIFLNPGKEEDSVQIYNLDAILEDTTYVYSARHMHMLGNKDPGSEIENGLEVEEVKLNFDSLNASRGGASAFVPSRASLPSIDEETVQMRNNYVGDQAEAPTILKRDKKNAAPFTDISLAPESSIKENNDGVSFSWDHARSPSQASNERNNSLEVFSEDDLSYHSGSRSKSMLSGFSSIFSSKSPD